MCERANYSEEAVSGGDEWETMLDKMMAPLSSGDVCLGPAHESHKREWSEARRKWGRETVSGSGSQRSHLSGRGRWSQRVLRDNINTEFRLRFKSWSNLLWNKDYDITNQLILYIFIRRTLQVAIKNTRVLTKTFNSHWIIHRHDNCWLICVVHFRFRLYLSCLWVS